MVSPTNLGLKTGARRAALLRFPHSATPVVCAVSVRRRPRSGLVGQMSARPRANAVWRTSDGARGADGDEA